MIQKVFMEFDSVTLYFVGALAITFVVFFVVLVLMYRKLQGARLEYQNALVAKERLWQVANHEIEIEVQRYQTLVEGLNAQREELQSELKSATHQVKVLLQKNARSEAQKAHLEKEKAFIELAKKQMLKDFEIATNRLYDQKQELFSSSNKVSVEAVIAPFRQQIQEFHKRVEDMVHKESVQRNQLAGQVIALKDQAHQLSSEANNLASALKGDNKVQGAWGELVLERLLESSGLVKGREYHIQQSLVDDNGKRFRPDVIVHLPDEKDIVIDSKVSLVAYERYSNLEHGEERDKALFAHLDSIKQHIRGLSEKNYAGLNGIKALDFVFLFIPVEAAYVLAVQENPKLFQDAYEKSIVLVSPSSLMVALKTVEVIWRNEKQNVNAEKIASSAGKLYDQCLLMVTAFDDIGVCLARTQSAYELAHKRLAQGRGNLLSKVEQLKVLGAKTNKKMPEKYKGDQESESVVHLQGAELKITERE